jgi:colanic acid/amylovoran biosynthesis glycosyltransferase
MIKVAHVMRSYLGQSETFIWQYLHTLKRVVPIVLTGRLENLEQFPLLNGTIKRVYGPRGSTPWVIDNISRRIFRRPFGYIEGIITRAKISLLHAHFGTAAIIHLPLCLHLGLPLLCTFYGHDLFVEDATNRLSKKYTKLFEKGVHFLVEGPFMKARLVSLGCPEEKISIQRIALNLEAYPFKVPSWNGSRPVRFLFVGRFVEKKGLEYALKALSAIRKEFPFQFRIIGGGELEGKLRDLTRDLGLNDEVVWLGIKTHHGVIEELNGCDILIQPSVTANNGDSEGGAPTIILEAQACGVPIISSEHADIPYVTAGGRSAMLSPERDVESLVENIRVLLTTAEVSADMNTKGRAHVEQFHNVRNEVQALENIYYRCLMKKETRDGDSRKPLDRHYV